MVGEIDLRGTLNFLRQLHFSRNKVKERNLKSGRTLFDEIAIEQMQKYRHRISKVICVHAEHFLGTFKSSRFF